MFNLGLSAVEKQNWAEAKDYFQNALELDPELHTIRYHLAIVAAHQNDPKVALEHFELLANSAQSDLYPVETWRAELEEVLAPKKKEESDSRAKSKATRKGKKSSRKVLKKPQKKSSSETDATEPKPVEKAAETQASAPKKGRRKKRLVLKKTKGRTK